MKLINYFRKKLGLCVHKWTVLKDSDWMYMATCFKCGKRKDYMKW